MRYRYLLLLLLLWTSAGSNACLEEFYKSQVGVRELTGKNDGPEVELYLSHVGLGKGWPYCSAFYKTGLDTCGIVNRVNAWAPTALSKHKVFIGGKFLEEPKPGDSFGIYSYRKKRVFHVGAYIKMETKYSIVTIEGNTNPSGTNEGSGVWSLVRPLYTINQITRWPE